jgi:hypothetical protein
VFEADLYAYFTSHPDLTGIGLAPGRLPEDPTFPFATYTRISGPYVDEAHDHAGGLVEARIQFEVWDDDWLNCWTAAGKVRKVFKRFRGTMGTTEVQSSRIDSDNDAEDPETHLPRRILDVFIKYREVA